MTTPPTNPPINPLSQTPLPTQQSSSSSGSSSSSELRDRTSSLKDKSLVEPAKAQTLENSMKTKKVEIFARSLYIEVLGHLFRGEKEKAKATLELMNQRNKGWGPQVDVERSINKMMEALGNLEGKSAPMAAVPSTIISQSEESFVSSRPLRSRTQFRTSSQPSRAKIGLGKPRAAPQSKRPADTVSSEFVKADSDVFIKRDIVNLHEIPDREIFNHAMNIRKSDSEEGSDYFKIGYSSVPLGGGGPDIQIKTTLPLKNMLNSEKRLKLIHGTLEKYYAKCGIDPSTIEIDPNQTVTDLMKKIATDLRGADSPSVNKEVYLEKIIIQLVRILLGSYENKGYPSGQGVVFSSIESSIDDIPGAEDTSLNDEYLLDFEDNTKILGSDYFNHGTLGGLFNIFFSSVVIETDPGNVKHISEGVRGGSSLSRLAQGSEGQHKIVDRKAMPLDVFILQGAADCRATNCLLADLLNIGYEEFGSEREARILYTKVQDGKGGTEFNKTSPQDHNIVIVRDPGVSMETFTVMDAYFPRFNGIPLRSLIEGCQNHAWSIQLTGATKYPEEQIALFEYSKQEP